MGVEVFTGLGQESNALHVNLVRQPPTKCVLTFQDTATPEHTWTMYDWL